MTRRPYSPDDADDHPRPTEGPMRVGDETVVTYEDGAPRAVAHVRKDATVAWGRAPKPLRPPSGEPVTTKAEVRAWIVKHWPPPPDHDPDHIPDA